MATVTGPRGTGNVSQSLRKVDMAEKILLLEPNAAPLTVLSARLSKKPTINPEYSWQEKDIEPRFDAVNNGAGYASGAVSIVVDNGAYFAANHIVLATRTGETMRVTAVAANTLTVVRGVGSTAAALVDNDELLVIGIAHPEGDTSMPARSNNPTKVTNYTQIFRKPFEETETLRHSDSFTTGSDWDEEAREKGVEHQKDKEYSFWHGHPSEDLTGSQPRRTTGGVFHYATQNISDAGGAFTEAEFFAALRPAFRYNPGGTLVGFGSMLVLDVLNAMPRGKLQIDQGETTFGLAVRTFISPHGTIRFISNPLFEGTKFSGVMALLDMSQIKYRYLSNSVGSRDSSVMTQRQAPDADTRKDEWLGEVGLQFGLSKRHAVVTGVTS